jgi:hypothetical protein
MKIKYENLINLYIALFLYNAVFLAFMGIRGGINTMKTKLQVQEEYETAINIFEEKEELVAGLLEDVQSHTTQIDKLGVVMPNRSQEEKYLIDLSLQTARAGYELKNYSITKSSSTQTDVNVTLEGNINQLNKLTTSLKDMERLNIVESIDAETDKDKVIIEVKIIIFNNVDQII